MYDVLYNAYYQETIEKKKKTKTQVESSLVIFPWAPYTCTCVNTCANLPTLDHAWWTIHCFFIVRIYLTIF